MTCCIAKSAEILLSAMRKCPIYTLIVLRISYNNVDRAGINSSPGHSHIFNVENVGVAWGRGYHNGIRGIINFYLY